MFLMRLGCRIWLWALGFMWISYSGTPEGVPENGCVLVGPVLSVPLAHVG